MEQLHAFQADLEAAPLWGRNRVQFMGPVLILSILFAFARVEARSAVPVMFLTLPAMIALQSAVGFARGLPGVRG